MIYVFNSIFQHIPDSSVKW